MAMHPILLAIRNSPSTYLPEASLVAFRSFCSGYLSRSAMEGRQIGLGYDGREFHRWVCKRFEQRDADAIAETTLVSSFSFSQESAFKQYFDLLDEFLQADGHGNIPHKFQPEKKTLFQMLRDIREKPAMYLGHQTFLGGCSYLMGDEHCYLDMGLPIDEDRAFFGEFRKWVESEKSRSTQTRPWFKVIQFWSGGIDFGTGQKSGAFWLFFHWLDQFAEISGKEGLFRV